MCCCLPKDAVPVVPAGERCAEGGGQPAVVAMPAEIDVTNADQVRGAPRAALDQLPACRPQRGAAGLLPGRG